MVRARLNTWLMAFSLSPAHFDRIMLGLMDSRLNSASAATFSTSMVCNTKDTTSAAVTCRAAALRSQQHVPAWDLLVG